MMRLVIFVCCFNSMILCFSPIVRVEEGELVGTSYELPNGHIVDAFLGVPYAAPPIFERRFEVRINFFVVIFHNLNNKVRILVDKLYVCRYFFRIGTSKIEIMEGCMERDKIFESLFANRTCKTIFNFRRRRLSLFKYLHT